MINHWTTD